MRFTPYQITIWLIDDVTLMMITVYSRPCPHTFALGVSHLVVYRCNDVLAAGHVFFNIVIC